MPLLVLLMLILCSLAIASALIVHSWLLGDPMLQRLILPADTFFMCTLFYYRTFHCVAKHKQYSCTELLLLIWCSSGPLGCGMLNCWSRVSLWRLHCGSPGFLCSSAKKRTITSTTVCVGVTAVRVYCDACMLVCVKHWTLSVFLSQLLPDCVKLCVWALRIEDSFKKIVWLYAQTSSHFRYYWATSYVWEKRCHLQ